MTLIDVITYDGDNNTLVYKYPHSEFNTLSQLIVHESQEAVFFKNGQMLDSFGPGKYPLHTGNIPLVSKLLNLPSGGVSPFRCEVYFVNKALALNYRWGTMSKARVMDNTYNLLLEIGASGTLGLKVIDPRMLLSKIVGTEGELKAEDCLNYFRENVSTKVKEYLARVMKKQGMNFLLLDTYLSDFSVAVRERLQETFNDVGVEIYNFVIGTISIPDEQYQVILEGQQDIQKATYERKLRRIDAESDAETDVIRAGGRAKSRAIEGYNWADEQVAEITKLYASNLGSNQGAVGMLAQAPMALAFGNMLRDNMEPILGSQFSNPPLNFGGGNVNNTSKQENTSGELGGFDIDFGGGLFPEKEKFDSPFNVDNDAMNPNQIEEDASPTESAKTIEEDPIEILTKLKKMLDMELISQAQYDSKVQEVLGRM
ncbi:SPFH domain-containing protein [Blautia sp. RTP21359st1_E11_RTP21359_211015]|uniref:SPFH domain-containing protein n=1 Tax=Blautia sp. RTP21359st1_E11_RTP21359_211015 TaxID=3141591 RepID=UPI0034A34844